MALPANGQVKVRECYNEIAKEDEGRVSIAQDIARKSTDSLRRIIAPSDGVGGVTLSHVCPHCHCFPLENTTSGGSRRGTATATRRKD